MASAGAIYSGYSGVLWSTVYSTLSVFNTQLSQFATATSVETSPSTQDIAQSAEAMFATLLNGTEAINTFALWQAWRSELLSLQKIQALPLVVSPTAQAYFNNRVTSYTLAVAALAPLVPYAPYGNPQNVLSGTPTVPSAGLLTFYEDFDYETPPPGWTASAVIAKAYEAAAAFLEIAQAVAVTQGASPTQLYDVVFRQYQTALFVAQMLDSYSSVPIYGFGTNAPTTNDILLDVDILAELDIFNLTNAPQPPDWNQTVVLPSMSLVADIINGGSWTEQLQQQAALRSTMLSTATSISTLLLSLRQPQTGQVSLTTLRVGESLMDVAARTTGNFEDWTLIAELNGLSPPFVGAVSSTGVAGWGSQLLLPIPGSSRSAVGTTPSYEANFLGIDLYIGPINGLMPIWAGDFQTISGYQNLAWALGRRLQTTLGALIYHPDFGSRIPPEVGAVQNTQTAGNITAYGKSALLGDPRVAAIPSAVSQILPENLIAFSASVQPNGFQSQTVTVNEVLSNLP